MKLTLYNNIALRCSRVVTTGYSTSFSLGIRTLAVRHRPAIYAIYGFVRLADEIVDTFFGHRQREMLERFRHDTDEAITEGVSSNPVLHSFQWAVNTYNIDREFIEAFLYSMEMDLEQKNHDLQSYSQYIYGSAEAVGLMCLRVFCHDDPIRFDKLREPARRLGSAFQKVNFLRDIKSDYQERGRIYFPGVDFNNFTEADKRQIEEDIAGDFRASLEGIRRLDRGSRRGVYLAYSYYMALFGKIRKIQPDAITGRRFRISNGRKLLLLARVTINDLVGII
ncbi:MAG: phytoene/squalene synthase family protein [Bacteroidales bacterium]|jgi:phytoene/squalene synthetase|nr:phytoene/squalene synthase family protein [Bacteroidales bacterium]